MKKIAFLFPGQGSQVPGMGKEIYEKYEIAREIYKKAKEVLNIDLEKLCFKSTEEELKKTENAQISIALTSLAILEVIKQNNIKADYAVGLSLGEYVALTYAGFMNIEDCFKLLQKRGYYMEKFTPNEDYSMAAIIGLDSKIIENACKEIITKEMFIMPSNYNYKNQTVISGNTEAVKIVTEKLKELGARKIVVLKTSGPFHTSKLEKASQLYESDLEEVKFNSKGRMIKVIKNIDGTEYSENDNIKNILAKHIVSPVRFDKTIEKLKNAGVNVFVEIGPGKTMTGFIKKELRDQEVKCFNIQNVEDIEKFLVEVKDEK